MSDDGRYAVLSITEGCEPVNQLWYCDLQLLPDGITGLCPFDSIEAVRVIVACEYLLCVKVEVELSAVGSLWSVRELGIFTRFSRNASAAFLDPATSI